MLFKAPNICYFVIVFQADKDRFCHWLVTFGEVHCATWSPRRFSPQDLVQGFALNQNSLGPGSSKD